MGNLVTWGCSNKQQHKTCMTRFKLLGDILVMAEKLAASVATAHAYFPTFSMKATGKKNEIGSARHHENKQEYIHSYRLNHDQSSKSPIRHS